MPKFKWDILGNFQTMWTIVTLPCSKRQASCPCQTLLRIISLKGRQNIWQSSDDKPDLTFCPFHCPMTRMTLGFEKTKRAFKIVMKINLYNMCLHCSTLMNFWYKTKTTFHTFICKIESENQFVQNVSTLLNFNELLV